MADLSYAKAGGPPLDWHGLRVFDVQTGREVRDVIEASTVFACGWVRKYRQGPDGRLFIEPGRDRLAEETIYGRFEIRRGSAHG